MKNSIRFFMGDDFMPVSMIDGNLKETINNIDLGYKSYYIIIDMNVAQLHHSYINELFARFNIVGRFIFDATEENKNILNVKNILDDAIVSGVCRDSAIIALGGGVVGNISGLVASMLYRGIGLVHIPTTFLAMSDSVFSAKQAVNGQISKNIYGSYLIPSFCIIDIFFLSTLPKIQIISGIIEIYKNALAFDSEKISLCIESSNKIRSCKNESFCWKEKSTLAQLIISGIESKQKLLIHDMKEKKDGLLLEYGHTVGHAIELESNGRLPHGIAVGLGMVVASQISNQIGGLSKPEVDLHIELLNNIGCPTKIPRYINIKNTIERVAPAKPVISSRCP